jgi:hypothetical protein
LWNRKDLSSGKVYDLRNLEWRGGLNGRRCSRNLGIRKEFGDRDCRFRSIEINTLKKRLDKAGVIVD